MPRYKINKGTKKQTGAPQGGMYGCILVVLLIMAFLGWTFYLALRPN